MKLNYQKGHASILFVIIVPALFGVFMLGSDGARALQQKARVMDATEVAALAVSAHADDNQPGSTVNTTIVTDVMEAYFPDLKSGDLKNIKIVRKNCDQIADCNSDGHRFFQYEVSATMKYDSWFPGNDAIAGFGDEISVSGGGTSRKYQSDAIDVMLVADFSGSMEDDWKGGDERKYEDLIDIINDVAVELDNFNDLKIPDKVNTIGIAPYNHYAHRSASKKDCDYKSYTVNQYGVGSVEHLVYKSANSKKINYSQTVTNAINNSYSLDSFCAKDSSDTRNANFHNVGLTKNMLPSSANGTFLNEIKYFRPTGGTASYLGLIEGTKLLLGGQNEKRLLIILSDGEDSPGHTPVNKKGPHGGSPSYKSIGEKLMVNHKLCESILGKLEEDEKEATIYLIGFDYKKGSTNKALDTCVGEDNIFYAENKEQILNKILSLIAEEIGHLK